MTQKRQIDWGTSLFIVGYHLLMLALIPFYFMQATPSGALIAISAILLYVTGLAVTGGYHRLFSHSTYKTNKIVEAVYLFFGTMATQGSALRWSYDHRLHHAHIDSEQDPYTVSRGFWHAHIWWMFRKRPPIEDKVVADLLKNKLVMFQHKYYNILMLLTNLMVTLVVGWALGDYFGAFLFAWLMRQFFLHHFTWFINSLAHYWGHQNYSTEHSAVDNYIISILTFGEGYHNYHHTFANDYRNGIRWYHFDPTKWLIWLLHKCGLAHSLKTANESRVSIAMIQEHKRALLDKVKHSWMHKKEEFEAKIVSYTDSLTTKLSDMNTLLQRYKASKADTAVVPASLKLLHKEIEQLRKALKKEWRSWRRLSRELMRAR